MISIVIPTLNEAGTLAHLLGQLDREDEDHEVIVVDGGSTDGSPDIAQGFAVRVIRTAPGRGHQIKTGASVAQGDILLFLHADSRFPAGGLAAIRERLGAGSDCVGGNFRLIFDGGSAFSQWLTGFYAWIRARGLYYGDSAIFVRRRVYDAIGGMHPIALMEDYDFTRRLERAGPTCCIEAPPLITSSRRFIGRRPVSIVWGWLKIHALYHVGLSPDRLARIYDSERRRSGPLAHR